MPQFERFDAPLRIGVIGDTHRSSRNRRPLPSALLEALESVDLILHLGDVNSAYVLDELREIAPVRAVHGNNDEPDLQRKLPLERHLKIGTHRIGMIHGHGTRHTARETALARISGGVECIIYGHSHRPECVVRSGILLVNPGSPTQRRYAPRHTYAMMTVDTEIDVEIAELD